MGDILFLKFWLSLLLFVTLVNLVIGRRSLEKVRFREGLSKDAS